MNLAQSIKRLIKFWDFNLDQGLKGILFLVIGPFPGGWITEALELGSRGHPGRLGMRGEPTGALEDPKGPTGNASSGKE